MIRCPDEPIKKLLSSLEAYVPHVHLIMKDVPALGLLQHEQGNSEPVICGQLLECCPFEVLFIVVVASPTAHGAYKDAIVPLKHTHA